MSKIDAISQDRIVKLMEEHGFPNSRIIHSVEVTNLALQISDLMTMDDLG